MVLFQIHMHFSTRHGNVKLTSRRSSRETETYLFRVVDEFVEFFVILEQFV